MKLTRRGAPYVLKGYTEQQRQQFLRLMAEGITRKYAAAEVGIPLSAVRNWLREDDAFADEYRRARIEQAHALGDEILEIADAPAGSMEAVQHAKLRVEARKWLMSKWAPRHYGEKNQTDHTHMVGVVMLPALDTEQTVTKALNDVAARLPGSEG